MSQPAAYTPQHSFVSDSATLANFPGQALDVEFQSVKATTDQLRANLALIQRDDGQVLNGSIGYDQLSAALQLVFSGISGTTTLTSSLVLNPLANTLAQGLVINQTLPTGTAALDTAYSANLISIVNNGYQTPAGGAMDSFGLFPVVAGFRVNYSAAGNGISTYPIHIGGLFATKATSVGQQLVGLNGTVYSNINSSGNDSFWALIGYANIGPLANIQSIYGIDAEVATSPTATIVNRVGVGSTSQGAGLGSTIDTAYMVTANADKYGAALPFNNLMVLWKSDGVTAPLGPAGSLIIANSAFSMGYGLNLPNVTFVTKIFDFGATKFQMDGSGNTTIGATTLGLGTNTLSVGGTVAVQSTSGAAFKVGPNGGTNPAFNVDASAASLAAGLNVAGAATGGTVAIAVIDSGANAALSVNAKGSGVLQIGNVSSGQVRLAVGGGGVLISSALTYGGVTFSNAATGTGNLVASISPVLTTPNLGTPSAVTLTNGTGLPTTGLTGTLQAAQEPAHTGDMTNTAGSLATTVLKTNGVSFTSYATAAVGQLPGTTTNDSATAGNIGEIVTSTIARASATAVTTATPKTVTSISLTAGDWDVDVVCGFIPANTTQVTQLVASMSTTTNVLDATEGKLGVLTTPATTYDGATQAQVSLPPFRFSLSGTTTVYLVAQSNFTVSTNAAFGLIKARRVR